MIPHHYHFIWMGKRFPYVNQLAVESVLLRDPEARITLHYEDPPDNAAWHALRNTGIEFRPIDLAELLEPWAEAPGIRATLAGLAANYPAGRSNVLRYLILFRWGGIYVDFDILLLKSLKPLLGESAFLGEERVFRSDDDRVKGTAGWTIVPFGAAFGLSWALVRLNSFFLGSMGWIDALSRGLERIWGRYGLNNAVLGCEPGHPFFRRAIELVPETDPAVRFNLGPILMNRVWDEEGGFGALRLGPAAFYAIPPSQTHRFFARRERELPDEAYLIHWCSSNEKEKAARLQPQTLDCEPGRHPLLIHRLAWPIIRDRATLAKRTGSGELSSGNSSEGELPEPRS